MSRDVMHYRQRHYKAIGSTLKSVNKFPSIDAQFNRFQQQVKTSNAAGPENIEFTWIIFLQILLFVQCHS